MLPFLTIYMFSDLEALGVDMESEPMTRMTRTCDTMMVWGGRSDGIDGIDVGVIPVKENKTLH